MVQVILITILLAIKGHKAVCAAPAGMSAVLQAFLETRCGVHSRGSTQDRGCDLVYLRTEGKYRNMSFITDRLPESGLLR